MTISLSVCSTRWTIGRAACVLAVLAVATTAHAQAPIGTITTIAGTGTAGYSGDGSSATAAQIGNPGAVAVDAVGNVYIADVYNQRVRKVSAATGTITTVAGNGTLGFSGDGGSAVAAQLALGAYPTAGLAVNAAGDLFIADSGNFRVRKVSAATGIITTVAGDGRDEFGFGGFGGDGGPPRLRHLPGRLVSPSMATVTSTSQITTTIGFGRLLQRPASSRRSPVRAGRRTTEKVRRRPPTSIGRPVLR